MSDIEKTTNLQLPLLVQNQAGKEITHNEALIILDNIVQNGVIDKDLTTPPTEPSMNDLYIVGENATGLWEDRDNQLAFYDNGWRFIEPRNGFIFWINDENKLYCFNGTKWQEIMSSSSGSTTPTEITELQNLSLLGVNTTADEDNKLSIKSNYVLFDNITNNSRIKINKATINDTASHLFQTNYSGRAEFGLIANDNFTLKVSNDGENWNNAFVVDKATGNIDFKGIITNNGNSLNNSTNLSISQIMPDWSRKESRIASTSYTAEKNGWIFIQGTHIAGTTTPSITINNTLFPFHCNAAAQATSSIFLPISTNDTYIANGTITTFYFIPCKGEN